jgi:hypothetical protein
MDRLLKFLWTWYETWSLATWLIALPIWGAGVSTVPIVGYFAGLPIWAQAVAALIVALIWMAILTGLVNYIKRSRDQATPTIPTQQADANPGNTQQAINTGSGSITQNVIGVPPTEPLQSDLQLNILGAKFLTHRDRIPIGARPSIAEEVLQVEITFRPNRPMQLARLELHWGDDIIRANIKPVEYLQNTETHLVFFAIDSAIDIQTKRPAMISVLADGEIWQSDEFTPPSLRG